MSILLKSFHAVPEGDDVVVALQFGDIADFSSMKSLLQQAIDVVVHDHKLWPDHGILLSGKTENIPVLVEAFKRIDVKVPYGKASVQMPNGFNYPFHCPVAALQSAAEPVTPSCL